MLNVEKKPKKCVGLYTVVPSSWISVWSGEPPRMYNADEKSLDALTPGSSWMERNRSASKTDGSASISSSETTWTPGARSSSMGTSASTTTSSPVRPSGRSAMSNWRSSPAASVRVSRRVV